jgi:hypothetical protein
MSDASELVPRSELLALAARVRELEAQILRASIGIGIGGIRQEGGTDSCTACHTDGCTDCHTGDCTHCQGDLFEAVLLPGELELISGRELVKRLQAGRAGQ